MAGAVGIVGAGLPERDAGQRIEIAAARADGKARRADADHAFQNQREKLPLLLRHGADGNGTGDVGCAVDILSARVEQVEFASLQQPVALCRHPVVDNGAMLAGS